MPSAATLRDMVDQLKPVGATFEGLKQHDWRLDEEVKALVSQAPEINALLRVANRLAEQSGVALNDILRELTDRLEHRSRPGDNNGS